MKIRLTLLLLLISTVVQPSFTQRFRTTIPYQNSHGKLITQATINGHTGTFLLDTGAPCCVSYTFAQKLGLKAGSEQRGQDSNGRPVISHLVVLDSLRLGNTTFSNLQAMRWEEGNMTEQFGIDGIIGYNLMQMGVIKFDSRNHLFTFSSSSQGMGTDLTRATPLLSNDFVPLVGVQLGKNLIDTVMFDSGAADFYEMSTRNYQRLRKHRKHIRHIASGCGILSLGASGMEQTSLKHRLKIPNFQFAGIPFHNVPTITTDGYDSRMGSALLRHGDVIIDYKSRIFYFLPHDTSSPKDLYRPEWEVVITITPSGHLSAGMVWNPKLPIQSGDRILSVNGKRFESPIDMKTATTTALISMPGDKATLTFFNARSGKEESLIIRKR